MRNQHCIRALVGFALFAHVHAYASQTNMPPLEHMLLQLPVDKTTITNTPAGAVVFGGAPSIGEIGFPALPRITYNILLPPDADLTTVSVALFNGKVEQVPGDWDLPPTIAWACAEKRPEPKPGGDLRNPAGYTIDNFQPETYLARFTTGKMREWRLLHVELTPYRYNPVSKRLLHLNTTQLKIDYARFPGFRPTKSRSEMVADKFRQKIKKSVINFGDMVHRYE